MFLEQFNEFVGDGRFMKGYTLYNYFNLIDEEGTMEKLQLAIANMDEIKKYNFVSLDGSQMDEVSAQLVILSDILEIISMIVNSELGNELYLPLSIELLETYLDSFIIMLGVYSGVKEGVYKMGSGEFLLTDSYFLNNVRKKDGQPLFSRSEEKS